MLETINDSDDLLKDFLSFEDLEKLGTLNDGGEKDTETLDTPDPLKQLGDLSPLQDITEPPVADEDADDTDDSDDNSDADDSDDTEDDGSKYDYKAFVSYLSDEGIVDYELDDTVENTPELIFESVKATIEKGIESYKESIPDTAKQFLDYLDKGGDPAKYIQSFNKPIDVNELDLAVEDNQEKVVREFLKSQDYSQDEIDETIQDYKDSLILEKQATLASKKLDKLYAAKQAELISEQEQAEIVRQEQVRTYINTLNTTIDTSNELAGLPVSNKVKADFKSYLLATGKDGLTQYQREVNENPVQTQLELAFLKFMKYDFSTASKKGKTEAVRNMKQIFKNNEPTVKGKSNAQEKEEVSNFDAFKAFRSRQS